MKPIAMNSFKLLVFCGLFYTILIGCSKKEDLNTDFAGNIAGTYNGTLTITGRGTYPASTTIEKINTTTVSLTVLINGVPISMSGIAVTSPSENNYEFSYGVTGDNIIGSVAGITINWTMITPADVSVFTGTRQ